MMKRILVAIALACAPLAALGQSTPNLITGQVPTAAQWNSYFAAKQDALGYVPLNRAGGAMTGKLSLNPSGSGSAGLNCGQGTAPIAPQNGDVWCTTLGVYAYLNGSTQGPFLTTSGGSSSWTGTQTFNGPVVLGNEWFITAEISPTISADQNDWTPTGLSTAAVIKVNGGAGDRNITGITGAAAGRRLTVFNVGSTNNIILRNANSGSTAGNRFCALGDISLGPNGDGAELAYDIAVNCWRIANVQKGLLSTVTSFGNSIVNNSNVLQIQTLTNAQVGTSYTVVAGDRGKLITTSNASAIAISVPQATGSFTTGFRFFVSNIGLGTATLTPTTSTIDGLSSLALQQYQGVELVSDGTNWHAFRGYGAPAWVYTSPTDFYANASTGNDSNDCLTSTVTGGHGPCLTVQHVINVASSYYTGSAPVNVHLTGSFSAGAIISGPLPYGASNQLVTGLFLDGGSSASTTINDTSSNCFTLLATGAGTNLRLSNMTLTKTAGCTNSAASIFAQQNAVVNVAGGMAFGTSNGEHVHVETNALVEFSAGWTVNGSALYHWVASTGGNVLNDGYALTCSGALTFSTFFWADTGSRLAWFTGSSFSGCGSVTGNRFNITTGALMSLYGNSTTMWGQIPGNNTGAVSNGGMVYPYPAPTINSCPNGAVQSNSTDNAFSVGFSGSASACAINFGLTKLVTPICISNVSGGTQPTIAPNVGSVTISGSFVNGTTIYVICKDTPW